MSHITHFYHLSALDYINTSTYPGVAPWNPSYTASDMVAGGSELGTALVGNYVKALEMRRKMHTAGALFSGRQPISNALVPGGVTTLFKDAIPGTGDGTDDQFGPYNATQTRSMFKSLLFTVRKFINDKYIDDILTVASAFGTGYNGVPGDAYSLGYFEMGQGCKRFLAYGDYPLTSTGKLAIKRGIVDWSSGTINTDLLPFDQANIKEYVGSSYYHYTVLDPTGPKHPFDGITTPDMKSSGYSWLKAPRYMSNTVAQVCEVGPLARMVVSYAADDASVKADDSDLGTGIMATHATSPYTVKELITAAMTLVLSPTTFVPATHLPLLDSVLGRHAARALEAKFLADAMAIWVGELDKTQSCYTYAKIPKTISTGYGLCEAPRGALGHWIKIEGRKTAKYQCVVPSTWNFSPKESATGKYGAVEQSLKNSNIGMTPQDWVINILRIVHPFDCCIACAVHVVNPEGKEMLKFAIGPDGRPTNFESKE